MTGTILSTYQYSVRDLQISILCLSEEQKSGDWLLELPFIAQPENGFTFT